MARIRTLLDAAREGLAGCIVIDGEPGIGKTTLLDAAAEMATGFRCLSTTGIEAEVVLGHAALLELLGPVQDRLADVPGAQADALASAMGWGPANAVAERFLVAAGTLSLLAATAERTPVLVLVDDLQWVDRASTRHYCSRPGDFVSTRWRSCLPYAADRPHLSCWRDFRYSPSAAYRPPWPPSCCPGVLRLVWSIGW